MNIRRSLLILWQWIPTCVELTAGTGKAWGASASRRCGTPTSHRRDGDAPRFLQYRLNQGRTARVIWTIALCAATPTSASGPDLIVSAIGHAVDGDASLSLGPVGGVMAYSFSTEACNVGDAPVAWVTSGAPAVRNRHPVIAQNMFRLKQGRFEQIGQSWLKHGFCGTNGSLCGTCLPENHTVCDSLAVGCSDPYGASLNAEYQNFHLRLGPKSDVNASTGDFPYASSDIPCEWCPLPTFTEVDRRLQVRVTDVDPALNAGAHYFVEAQYIAPDESAVGNGGDNIAWRQIMIEPATLAASAAPGSMTHPQAPAIFAWQHFDPAVQITEVIVPDDGGPGFEGRFWVAARVTELSDGWWHYEYAVQNGTSDRSAQSFAVPMAGDAQVVNVGFHDVNYHSGERIDSTDWTPVRDDDSIRWSTAPFDIDIFANALRWGTLYNFRFDATVPPTPGSVELALFKPGSPESVLITTIVPAAMHGCDCFGDVNDDGAINGDDIATFIAMYLGTTFVHPCADLAAPGNGSLDAADITAFVSLLLADGACP